MANFKKSLSKVFKHEGLDFNSRFDSGGQTRYGITEKVAKSFGLDVKTLTKKQAEQIYKKSYWNPLNIDYTHQEVANTVFDFAVNAGVFNAGRVFQRALNLLNVVLQTENKTKILFEELKIDGLIGTKTKSAYQKLFLSDIPPLIAAINGLRFEYYESLNKKMFNRSWFRRLHV
jgi:lysozyme family protein